MIGSKMCGDRRGVMGLVEALLLIADGISPDRHVRLGLHQGDDA